MAERQLGLAGVMSEWMHAVRCPELAARSVDIRTAVSADVSLCECGCGEPAPIARTTDKRRGYVAGQPVRFIRGHSGVLSKSTKGKTWEEIYGVAYAQVKREQVRLLGRRPRSAETLRRMSETKKRAYADGRTVNHQRGKPLSKSQKRKIATARRSRYGTRASMNKKVRYTAKYRAWRQAIFARDLYTCQRCRTNTRKARRRVVLHAHHRVELWRLLQGLTFRQAMEDSAVWDMNNGETLCLSCHRKEPTGAYLG